jgi:hypothetical protein
VGIKLIAQSLKNMEKINIENSPTKTSKDKESLSREKKWPIWLKAAVLGLGLLKAESALSQDSEAVRDQTKEKNKTDLMQKVSSFFRQASAQEIKSLDFLDMTGRTPEEQLKLKTEIKNQAAEYLVIAGNPEEYYNKIVTLVEKIKDELITHFSSPEFLKKLEIILPAEKAQKEQANLVNNLKSVNLIVASPDSIAQRSVSKAAGASYSPIEHRILIPFAELDEEKIMHELIHSAYRGDQNLSPEEEKILNINFQKNKHFSPRENEYQHKVSERIVRKKLLDLEMERLGLKKYREKFTHEHYELLKKLRDENKLGQGASELLDTSTEKQLQELMNNLAFDDAKKMFSDHNQNNYA